MCTWGWWPCGRPQKEELQQLPCADKPSNGQSTSSSVPAPSGPVVATPARAPIAQDLSPHQRADDTGPQSTVTLDSPTPSARPGVPANPVSLATQASRTPQPAVPKPAPGPSYESDDEGEGAATVEERLNEITRSVRGHANAAGAGSLDDAARRQAEEAAKRLAADRSQPLDALPKASVAAAADGAPAHVAAAVPPATCLMASGQGPPAAAAADFAEGAGAHEPQDGVGAQALVADGSPQPISGEFEIDLDIDLTKGHLKVDYSTRGLLGQGGFAAVYKGRYKGQRVAVKMIKKTANSSLADLQEDINALRHELHILRQVNHPNIVTLFGGCLKPPHIFLVEERMEGTLDFYVHQVRKHDALSVREVVYFALDIACGLSYLHPRIVHRDLKPANVLLSREGRCKISDFGLARTKIKEYLSTKNLDAGTTAYIAPECFMSMDNPDIHDLRRSVTDRTDIYAVGIIMWEMLAGKRPWQGLKPLLVAYQVAYRSLRPPVFELGPRCPSSVRQLIEECWCQEPKQRPNSQQVVNRLLEILNELPPEQDSAAHDPASAQSQPQQSPPLQPVSPHDVVLQP